MKILAIDTATEALSVALNVDGEVTERASRPGRGHGTELLGYVDELLGRTGLRLRDLDAIAVGRGPGAFTGVRIGVAVAQGLATGAELPVVPVSDLATLALLALEAGRRESVSEAPVEVLACLDARLGGLYVGRVRVATPHRPDLLQIAALSEALVNVADPALRTVAGEGLPAARRVAAGHGLHAAPELLALLVAANVAVYPDLLPGAGAISRLAVAMYAAGLGVSALEVAPVYLRDEVATRSTRAPGAPRDSVR